MVSLLSLWLPVLVATIIVYLAGFIMNMVLPHHRGDFTPITDEDGFSNTIRSQELAPGQYHFPFAETPEQMKDPAWIEKLNNGPVGLLLIVGNGNRMPRQLALQLAHMLAITIFAAYIGSATLPAGVEYLKVFQVVGATAFLGYAGALFPYSIWHGFSCTHTWKTAFDGLVYGLLTAGVFGWLWP